MVNFMPMFRDQPILLFSLLFFFPAILFFPTYYAQNFAHQKFNLLAKNRIVIIKYNACIYNITVNSNYLLYLSMIEALL